MKLTKEKIKSVRQRLIDSENDKIKYVTKALEFLSEDQELKAMLKESKMNKSKYENATEEEIEKIYYSFSSNPD